MSVYLEVGKRYTVFHKTPAMKRWRVSVMDYLGREANESHRGEGPNYLFNARPVAGTQSMPPSWIIRIDEAQPNEKIVLNKIVRWSS